MAVQKINGALYVYNNDEYAPDNPATYDPCFIPPDAPDTDPNGVAHKAGLKKLPVR